MLLRGLCGDLCDACCVDVVLMLCLACVSFMFCCVLIVLVLCVDVVLLLCSCRASSVC